MSDINLDFTVSNNSIDFTVQPNDITITPTDVQLTFNTSSQLNAGGSNTQLQYNNGDLLDGIPTATYDGANLSLGNVANLKITGGTNGYVLQTDGTGNLDWAAAGGGGGNGTPGGSNTQIQYNDSGTFGGNTGFTFNEVSGNVAIPGNLIVTGNISGGFIVANANYANYAGNAFSVSGSNVSGAVNLATYATTANSVAGANVVGEVANANYATYAGNATYAITAGTVTTNAQPNITSIGTLANLTVSGNITAGNANLGNLVIANFFQGSGNRLSNIQAGNISGNIPTANYASYAGNVTLAGQGNITSLGRLTDLFVTDTRIHLGFQAGYIGSNASTQGANSIAIGTNAGNLSQDINSVAIGYQAGSNNQSANAVAIGYGTAQSNQGIYAVAVGSGSGSSGQGNYSVGVGLNAGFGNQGANSVAIGRNAGVGSQGSRSVAVGTYAGNQGQGNSSVAIGANAGYSNQHATSIVINATGANLDTTQANSLFVKPIRDVTGNVDFTVTLKYNPTTGEIGYV